jgi:hypothetical protein
MSDAAITGRVFDVLAVGRVVLQTAASRPSPAPAGAGTIRPLFRRP